MADIILYVWKNRQWRAEGGERGAGPGHPRPGEHQKSEITKIETL